MYTDKKERGKEGHYHIFEYRATYPTIVQG